MPECNVDILQVLGSGDRGHVLWTRSDVKNDRLLDPGNHKVGAFAHHSLFHTSKSVKKNSFKPFDINIPILLKTKVQ